MRKEGEVGMRYQSPIDLITGQMNLSFEDEIVRAVQRVGIDVDKEELLKALRYDREQYQKGYDDRDSEIVRCKDCKNYNSLIGYCKDGEKYVSQTWFCADGERK